MPIVADFERADVPDFEAFFPLVDHLILSRGFAAKLTGETEAALMARALWTPARQIVIITGGENGCHAFDGKKVRHFAAFPADVVDTTGCGDVFHGVYAATLAWEFPLETRIRWASAAAALKTRQIGAQRGIPRRDEVERLFDSLE